MSMEPEALALEIQYQETSEADVGVTRHLWTREEFQRLGELGLFEGRRVELVHGEIIDMAPMAVPHAVAVMKSQEALDDIVQRRYWLRVQLPFLAPSGSEFQPDLALIERGAGVLQHPSTAILVVEISDTTLSYDRRIKAPLYAAAGVSEYWIVNLQKSQVEVRREPIMDTKSKTGFVYRSTTLFTSKDVITPRFDESKSVQVADLLP